MNDTDACRFDQVSDRLWSLAHGISRATDQWTRARIFTTVVETASVQVNNNAFDRTLATAILKQIAAHHGLEADSARWIIVGIIGCDHPRPLLEIRRRIQSNGVVAFWRQCLNCGQVVGTALKHCEAPPDAKPFDEAARTKYWEARAQRWRDAEALRRADQQRQSDDWWNRYNRYLESEEWQRKRRLVMERDQRRCQARLDGCSIYATQVHHLTYKHVFNEPLFDLVAICDRCHEVLHDENDDRCS